MRTIRRANLPAAFLLPLVAVHAAAPDWLRTLVSAPLPSYPPKTNAVVLLDERVITVKDSGDIRTSHRVALKILRPEGKDYGLFRASFDKDTRLTYLRAWSFPAGQPEYEVKEKEAVETGFSGESLYSDVRQKILSVPAADPGSVVGFEYEQKDRPFVLQHVWDFQRGIPVRKARLVLQLPPGWEFRSVWRNYTAKRPSENGNQWIWELDDLAAIEAEEHMPPREAVTAQMALTYLARGPAADKSHASWRDVGAWYSSLAAPRLATTPEIARKTAELVASAATPWKKVEALAAFVQSQIRYVAIPIGISSHQPHAAGDVLANRYGDCKDKATLLKTMLREVGVDSYYVLVNSERGAVNPEFPSVLNFDHVILAIRQPPNAEEGLFAKVNHPALGRLVLFDPTDALIPLGTLPDAEQSAYGLLVKEDGSELLPLPLHSPSACRLIRIGSLKLLPDGSLSGSVQEQRWGRFAAEARAAYRRAEGESQKKVLESFLAQSLGHFQLTAGSLENLDNADDIGLTYRFTAPNYGKTAGPYLLVRPRVLGAKAIGLGDKQTRQYPVSLLTASVESDRFDIELPAGYEVDELPLPVTVDYSFARYASSIEKQGNNLHYERHYLMRQVEIPKERFDDFWNLQRLISADEHSYAILKKKP
jgi:hypothetical protein